MTAPAPFPQGTNFRDCVHNLREGPCATYKLQLIYSFLNLVNPPPPLGWVMGGETFQFRENCYQMNNMPEGQDGGKLLDTRNKEKRRTRNKVCPSKSRDH